MPSVGPLEVLIILAIVVLVPASLALYFLPSIVAFVRDKTNKWAIFILNLLLGWSLIGWVAALVWAVMKEESDASR